MRIDVGDLVILKDFFSYLGECLEKHIHSPCVGVIVKYEESRVKVLWTEINEYTWEHELDVIIISGHKRNGQ